MKRLILLLIVILLRSVSFGQAADYKVVFDLSTRDSVSHQALIRELKLIRENNPEAKLEVVVYGQGLNMVVADRSPYGNDVRQILSNPNTRIAVCEFTLKRNAMDPSRLIPGVITVKDGIYEIITRQREGWGYIKVAH
jgi:uncharacterized protein